MRSTIVALFLVLAGGSVALAQNESPNSALIVPKFDVELGFNYVRANAPPSVCNCFGLEGGEASATYHLTNFLGIAGEVTGGTASNISTLGQGLTLMTFGGGPRVQLTRHRLQPFAQGIFGYARGSNSYFPTATSFTTSASSFMLHAGGGLDLSLSKRFSVRAFDVEYLRTTLPNGTTNSQEQMMIGAGLVVKFGNRNRESAPAPVAKRPSEISFSCSTASPTIQMGQMLDVVGNAHTDPDQVALDYFWKSDGGTIKGSGRKVSVDTTGMTPGLYHIHGKVNLLSSPSTSQECDAEFQVTPVPPPPASEDANIPVDAAERERVFHENVADALFDYDSYKIRPDAQAAIEKAAKYLNNHRDMVVTVGGYADDRGSAEYNLALGVNRANAARDALVSAGVSGDRIKVISYGKESQVCAVQNEACWQLNRRAAFNIQR